MILYFQEEIFENLREIEKAEYENCRFLNADFSNLDLSECKFINCEFLNSNLSLAKLNQTLFQNVRFIDSKLLGLNFENCNDFSLSFRFENCQLNHSTFHKLKIKKTQFINCQMNECDFSECDLTESVFKNSDLNGTQFDFTNLERTDFRTSYNFSIDPENNKIKGAHFSIENIRGLLTKFAIKIE